MVPDRPPISAVALLLLAGILLANPLYLRQADRGSQVVDLDETALVDGIAQQSPAVERTDDLPVTARFAVRRYVETGSFAVDRHGPPLALHVLGGDGRYLGSIKAGQVFDPAVTVGKNRTELTLEPVAVETVESAVGVTPPERLEDNHTSRRIAVLADRSEAVFAVGAFRGDWEAKLEEAVRTGALSVSNENDVSAVAPLGDEVEFVVADGTPSRVTVRAANESVVLELSPVSNQTLVSSTAVEVVEVSALPPGAREVALDAVHSSDGYVRFADEDVEDGALSSERPMLLRSDDRYYVVYRGHADGFSLRPLVGALATGLGLVVGAVGVVALYRDWR